MKNKYIIHPLKKQLKLLFETFYKKGQTSPDLLTNTDKIELLNLYTKINQEIGKKYTIETHFQTHYSQYTRDLRKKEKQTKSIKKIKHNKIRLYNKQIEQLQEIKKETKEIVRDNDNTIEKQGEMITKQRQLLNTQENKINKNNLYYILQKEAQNALLEKYNEDNTIIQYIIKSIIHPYDAYKKAINKCLESDKIDSIKTIGILTDSLANFYSAIGFQNLIKIDPKTIQYIIQNNTQINTSNENKENKVSIADLLKDTN